MVIGLLTFAEFLVRVIEVLLVVPAIITSILIATVVLVVVPLSVVMSLSRMTTIPLLKGLIPLIVVRSMLSEMLLWPLMSVVVTTESFAAVHVLVSIPVASATLRVFPVDAPLVSLAFKAELLLKSS